MDETVLSKNGEYIHIVYEGKSPSGKTMRWKVEELSIPPARLGEIKWFGRWRCYAYFPLSRTVYESTCLRDISEFCQLQTANHKRK